MAGSLGLQGAYASGSLQALLRQRMQDQIDAERRARQAMESDRRFGLDQQAHASTEQLKRSMLQQQMAERSATLSHQIQGERDTAAAKATGPMAMGDTVDQTPFTRTFAGTASESAFTPQQTLPSTQFTGTGEPGSLTATKAPQTFTGKMTYAGSDAQRQAAKDQEEVAALLSDPKTPEPIKGFLRVRGALPKGEAVPAQLFADQKPAGAEPLEQVMEGGKPVYRPRSQAAGKEAYHAPPQPDRVLIQSGDSYIPRADAAKKLAAGGTVPLAETSTTRTMSEGAQMMVPHVVSVKTQAEALDKAGLFGPMMSRVRHIAETVGSADAFENAVNADPELQNDRRIGRFATSLGLLASGVARVHGGARGGGSPTMYANFRKLLSDAGTLPLFLGRIDAVDEYMTGYAEGPQGAQGPTGVPAVGGTFQGGKVLKVTPVP